MVPQVRPDQCPMVCSASLLGPGAGKPLGFNGPLFWGYSRASFQGYRAWQMDRREAPFQDDDLPVLHGPFNLAHARFHFFDPAVIYFQDKAFQPEQQPYAELDLLEGGFLNSHLDVRMMLTVNRVFGEVKVPDCVRLLPGFLEDGLYVFSFLPPAK